MVGINLEIHIDSSSRLQVFDYSAALGYYPNANETLLWEQVDKHSHSIKGQTNWRQLSFKIVMIAEIFSVIFHVNTTLGRSLARGGLMKAGH